MSKKKTIWDKVGITASSICLVHCVLQPVLFPILMLQFMYNEQIEHYFLAGTFAFVGAVLYRSYVSHRQKLPLLIYGTSIFPIILSWYEIHSHTLWHILFGIWFIVAHAANIIAHQTCEELHCCLKEEEVDF